MAVPLYDHLDSFRLGSTYSSIIECVLQQLINGCNIDDIQEMQKIIISQPMLKDAARTATQDLDPSH